MCFLLKVKKDRLEEYKRRHNDVWPEMLDALHETGWRNYSLFLRDDGLLVGYFECDDFHSCICNMSEREVNRRWQTEMAGFFEQLEGRHADESMVPLPEIFHLD